MPELIAAYPDAKIIVSMRDPDAWLKSCKNSVGKAANSLLLNVLAYLDPSFVGKVFPLFKLMIPCSFGEKGLEDEANAKKVYLEMHEEVRQIVPKDRLLEYKLGQGWEPICNFLGKDVPPMPFPHVNEGAEFAERQKLLGAQTIRRIAKNFLPSLLGVMAVVGGYLYLK